MNLSRREHTFRDPADWAGSSDIFSTREGFHVVFNDELIVGSDGKKFTFQTYDSARNYLTILEKLDYLLKWLDYGYHLKH